MGGLDWGSMHLYIHMYRYRYRYRYLSIYLYIYICRDRYLCVHMYIDGQKKRACANVHMYVYICIPLCVWMYVHMHSYEHAYTSPYMEGDSHFDLFVGLNACLLGDLAGAFVFAWCIEMCRVQISSYLDFIAMRRIALSTANTHRYGSLLM